MHDILDNTKLLDALISISKEAGEAILKVYNSDFDYQIKDDLSPLTEADELSNQIIHKRLKILSPGIPILSEEDNNISYKIRSQWDKYWLVDPLDGTKEFIKKNGEFTVNIALIENHMPILGIIYIPVSKETYWGSIKNGSFYSNNKSMKQIFVSEKPKNPLRIITSRSHPSKNLELFLNNMGDFKIISKGSSIKFCLIASGMADLYPRLGPTSEWDTAAGHAIVKSAGGDIVTDEGEPLRYNLKDNILNPNFIVSQSKVLTKKALSVIKNT